MDSFGAAPAGFQHLLVRSRRLLPVGRPALADRIRMGNRRAPRRMRADVRQRLAMDVERLPSVSRLFRRSLQGVLEPVVPNPQDAAWRRLHDAFAHHASRISELLHAGTIRHLGRPAYLRARVVKIFIVTPEAPRSTLGNAVTANRWAGILRELGHDVTLAMQWMTGVDDVYDVLIALHARRSYPSIERFRRAHPDRPLIVALTGTDLYSDLPDGN